MFLVITRVGLRSSLVLLLATSALVPMLIQPVQAQSSPQCEALQPQRDLPIRELLDQVQQSLGQRQTEVAMATLQRALELTQQVKSDGSRAELLKFITEISESEPPMGLLVETVRQAQAEGQTEAIPPLLVQTQQIAQSLPSGYTSTKIAALVGVARHYAALNQPDQAVPALVQAQRAVPSLQGADFQVKALTGIAQQYLRLDQPDAATPLLDRASALAADIEFPNSLQQAWTWEPIAVAYAQVGAFDQALALAKNVPADVADGFYQGDTLAQIAAQYDPAQFNQAEALIQQIERSDLRGSALIQLARAHWDAGETIPAVALLDDMAGLISTEQDVTQQWGLQAKLALAYADMGHPDRALAVTTAIPDQRTRFDTLTRIALSLSEADADAVIDTITADLGSTDPYQRGSLIADALMLLTDSHRYTQAIRLSALFDDQTFLGARPEWLARIAQQAVVKGDFDAATQAVNAIPETWADYRNQSWQAIALAHATNGETELANQAVGNISNFGSLAYQIRTLAKMAQIYQAAGQPALAQQLLEQALQITRRFETDLQVTDALAAIAVAYAQANNPTQANSLRTEALQIANREADISSHDYLLRGMVQQYLEAGQYDSALAVALSYRAASNERRSALSQVIEKMRDAGQLEPARQAATAVPEPEVRTRLLVGIAGRYLQEGNRSQATATLARAFEAAKNIPDPESRTIAVREDLTVEDSEDRGSLLTDIALKYAQAGDSSTARQVANTLKDAPTRRAALQGIRCLEAAPR